jgi:hypothetical protein
MMGPQDIPGTGRFAILTDPQGAMFALYKPPAAEAPNGGWHLRGNASHPFRRLSCQRTSTIGIGAAAMLHTTAPSAGQSP